MLNSRTIAQRAISRNRRAAKQRDDNPAHNSLLNFTRYTKPDYQVNWHHEVVCGVLDRFVAGDIKRLMLFMPPRHGKSELVSRRLPAYIFGHNPNAKVISTSYSADLASMLNRDVQRIMDSPEYARLFPETKLWGKNIRTVADGSYLRNSDVFEIVNHAGYYRSAGVGGGITGMGFDYGIIDDPFKNRKEANSGTQRRTVWEWYTSTFYTRQEGDASILVTLTRWHEDDLAGRLLNIMQQPETEEDADFADQWTVLSFPAIAGGHRAHYDIREEGEALWRAKYDEKKLGRIERAIGGYDWSALYQQSPLPAGGGLFDATKIQIVDTVPECVQTVRFYDLAVTEKKTSDYTVGVKMGLTADNTPVILHVWRDRRELPAVHEAIVQNAAIDGRQTHIRLEAEKAGIVQLQFLLRDKRMNGYVLDAKPPQGDKYTRAAPVAARVNAGVVQMVRGAWNSAFLDELSVFNMGAHDDQVDALSGAWDMLASGDLRKAQVVDNPFYG